GNVSRSEPEDPGEQAPLRDHTNVMNHFIPLMSWAYETLEEAAETAKSGRNSKNLLSCMIFSTQKVFPAG
ncbi:MAG TPA: hypothetical protein VKG25_13585, partial [Bryobacteraceae bacterium]|nr:hypothetical protein [Bryobacteraceae bacterium]